MMNTDIISAPLKLVAFPIFRGPFQQVLKKERSFTKIVGDQLLIIPSPMHQSFTRKAKQILKTANFSPLHYGLLSKLIFIEDRIFLKNSANFYSNKSFYNIKNNFYSYYLNLICKKHIEK